MFHFARPVFLLPAQDECCVYCEPHVLVVQLPATIPSGAGHISGGGFVTTDYFSRAEVKTDRFGEKAFYSPPEFVEIAI
jgi:hypothetical protein